jgi:hypothetical protein
MDSDNFVVIVGIIALSILFAAALAFHILR